MRETYRHLDRKKLRQQLLIKILMVNAGNDSNKLKDQIRSLIEQLKAQHM